MSMCLVAGLACMAGCEMALSRHYEALPQTMTLISNQENTTFEIRESGASEWRLVGKGKIIDVPMGSCQRCEVRATPRGYRSKSLALASPVKELRFTFEISDKLGSGAPPAPRPDVPALDTMTR